MNASQAGSAPVALRSPGPHPRATWTAYLNAAPTPHDAWAIISLTNAPADLVRDWLVTPDSHIVTEAMLRTMLNGWATRDHQHQDMGWPTRATQFAWVLHETPTQDLRPLPRWADRLPLILNDPNALATLAMHPDVRLRRRVANNTNTPPPALAALMTDPDAQVRWNASETFSARLGALA